MIPIPTPVADEVYECVTRSRHHSQVKLQRFYTPRCLEATIIPKRPRITYSEIEPRLWI